MERDVPAQAQFPPLRPAEFGVDPEFVVLSIFAIQSNFSHESTKLLSTIVA